MRYLTIKAIVMAIPIALPGWAGNACVSTKTGNWSDATAWSNCGGGAPGNGDTVSVGAGHTITANQSVTVGASERPYFGYLYSIDNSNPATGCTATCTAALTGGTTPLEAPALACFTQPNGDAYVDLASRGWYPAGATAPTGITVTGTGCSGGTYALGFESGNGTPAISFGTNDGKLVVATGAELTVRGSVISSKTLSAYMDVITMQPGSTLTIDPSVAGANTLYTVGGPTQNLQNQNTLRADCTAAQPCTVRTLAGSLPGSLANPNALNWRGGGIYARYVNFSNIGDDKTYGFAVGSYVHGIYYSIANSTFTDCGGSYVPTIPAEFHFVHNYNVHTRSRVNNVASVAYRALMSFYSAAARTTGTREIIGNVFDGKIINLYNPVAGWGFTVRDNYFGENTYFRYGAPALWSGNFSRITDFLSLSSESYFYLFGDSDNSYFFADMATFNPHWTGVYPGKSIQQSVFDLYRYVGGDSGEVLIASDDVAGTITMTNSIVLPDSAGMAHSELSCMGTLANPHVTLNHNTWWGGYSGLSFGAVNIDEGRVSPTGMFTLKSNVLYAPDSAKGNFIKQWTWKPDGTGGTDTCAAGDCDYNAGFNHVLTQTCPNCTNQGNGYSGKWTATPGTHDIDILNPDDNNGPSGAGRVDPRFVDVQRSVALFDSKYLGNAAAAWQSGTEYNVGDMVSVALPGYYGGLPVNFRCIKAHTAAGTDQPMGGAFRVSDGTLASLVNTQAKQAAVITFAAPHGLAPGDLIEVAGSSYGSFHGMYRIRSVPSATTLTVRTSSAIPSRTQTDSTMTVSPWRVYWELASLHRLREGIAAQRAVTDGAIGCAGCTMVQTLLQWVRRGYTPQNPKLWKAGHDGADIGAVPIDPYQGVAGWIE